MLSTLAKRFASGKKDRMVVFFGPPGVGKGTQAKLLEKEFNLYQISTGDALRAEIRGQTQLGKRVKGIIESGGLVDDDTIMDILQACMQKNTDNNGYIFDGIPRTIGQVEKLDALLAKMGTPLTHVLYLSVNIDELRERVCGRLFHPGSGRVYHKVTNPPKKPMTDDITGEPLIIRKDDTPEVFNQRMNQYFGTFQPCIDYYSKKGILQTFPVDGQPIDVVHKKLHAALQ
ncbi:adenylate kinase [Trichomonas vaginalis G3]|uniref:Adenylate kinase n=1 Tax=Trichomonas vaginalis (strain ATCC PRA-98 / G3) TaxID=412133 RepID=A2FQ69_TRIV3|nr:adenylate kinase [Trichomonas vaginalis G3]EAX92941.1 adenylate kinase [Trichomonas vaginalis G3]KAI5553169.1 adenylate kinase [Trichomonas vaginalis G3]|eukprot:XP_001305871.1 adenylate kinase [Trichomonas vaginalis G3]